MPRVSARALKVLSAGLAGATALAIAAVPAHAAQANRPHAAPTANQLAKKANADFLAASSFSAWSRGSTAGVTLTVTETIAPQGCLVTIDGGGGLWSQDLDVGASLWVRLSDKSWESLGYTGTDLGYVEGKWVTLAAYLQALGITNLPPASSYCHSREPSGLPSSGWTLGKKMIKVSGQRAWQIFDKRDKISAAVSAARTPEFLAVTLDGQTVYLSHYNAPVTLTAPPAGDVITSLPPLPAGSAPVPGQLGRLERPGRVGPADRLAVRPGLLRGLALALSKALP